MERESSVLRTCRGDGFLSDTMLFENVTHLGLQPKTVATGLTGHYTVRNRYLPDGL